MKQFFIDCLCAVVGFVIPYIIFQNYESEYIMNGYLNDYSKRIDWLMGVAGKEEEYRIGHGSGYLVYYTGDGPESKLQFICIKGDKESPVTTCEVK